MIFFSKGVILEQENLHTEKEELGNSVNRLWKEVDMIEQKAE